MRVRRQVGALPPARVVLLAAAYVLLAALAAQAALFDADNDRAYFVKLLHRLRRDRAELDGWFRGNATKQGNFTVVRATRACVLTQRSPTRAFR